MTAMANGQECEEVRELLGAYALGALDPDEQTTVSSHLAMCPACRAEAASYASVVEALGVAAPREAPPPSLRDSIMASIGGSDVRPTSNTIAFPSGPQQPAKQVGFLRRRAVQVLSAAAILLLIGVGILAYLLSQTIDERDQAQAAQEQIKGYLSSGAQTVAMAELPASTYKSGQGHGTVLTAPGKPTMIVVGGCPPSSDSRTYHVWVAINGQRTPVGTLEVGDDWTGWLMVETPEAISSYDEIGVTMVTDSDRRDDLLVAQV